MAISVKELLRWVKTLELENEVAVDDGGLTLVELGKDGETGAYYEVGGIPLSDDNLDIGDASSPSSVSDVEDDVLPF